MVVVVFGKKKRELWEVKKVGRGGRRGRVGEKLFLGGVCFFLFFFSKKVFFFKVFFYTFFFLHGVV